MINALYVGGNKTGIPEISESNIHLDYVQNGMIGALVWCKVVILMLLLLKTSSR